MLWGRDKNILPRITFRLQLKQSAAADGIAVRLNGVMLGGGKMMDDWLELSVDPELIKQHENDVEMELAEDADTTFTVRDLMVIVKYDP